jgi:hypothetical protein
MKPLFRWVALAAASPLLAASPAHAYRVLIDYNTFQVADGLSGTNSLKCDGIWNIPQNSNLTTAQWETVYSGDGPGWTVSEDNPPPNNVGTAPNNNYTSVETYAGYVNDAFCYNETGSTVGGTLLSDSQITADAANHGGQVVVLTRGYSTNTSNGWYTAVQRCLSNSLVSGVAMETVSSYSSYDCDALVDAVLKAGKRMYFLLPSGNDAYFAASVNYLKWKQPADMQNANVFVVVCPYQTQSAPWYGDVNSAQGTIALAEELNGVSGGGVADNIYSINNWHSGLALTESGTGNSAPVEQANYTGATSQGWYLTYLGGGNYSFINSESFRAMDVASASTAAGAGIVTYASDTYAGGNDQLFSFTPQTNGSDNFKAACSGLSTEPSGGSQTAGVDLVQEPYTTATYQDWVFNLLTPTITSFSPGSGPVGTSVVVTGTNFYDVASVSFNGVTAGSYTVNSPTQITVTLPSGATTGAVSLAALGDVATSSTNFTVTVPDLTITNSHTGNFTQADTGDTYTITVTNSGVGPTIGTVSVADTLPSGLTATALTGTGWTAAANFLSATRTDALAAGSSYPHLTLTVNVSATAAASLTNTATVSGGGETNTANDTATSPTTIIALTPSQAWRYQYFGTTADTGNAADSADPSGDGLDNLLKYALGLNPLVPTVSTVTADTTTGYLRLTVPKNANATDIDFAVQVTGNLGNPGSWTTAGTTIEQSTASLLQVYDNTPLSAGGQQFIRLQVIRP